MSHDLLEPLVDADLVDLPHSDRLAVALARLGDAGVATPNHDVHDATGANVDQDERLGPHRTGLRGRRASRSEGRVQGVGRSLTVTSLHPLTSIERSTPSLTSKQVAVLVVDLSVLHDLRLGLERRDGVDAVRQEPLVRTSNSREAHHRHHGGDEDGDDAAQVAHAPHLLSCIVGRSDSPTLTGTEVPGPRPSVLPTANVSWAARTHLQEAVHWILQ